MFLQEALDDEEDIFSKNSRELQIKVQSGHNVKIETHPLPQAGSSSDRYILKYVYKSLTFWPSLSRIETPTSSHHNESNRDEDLSKDWVTFEDEDKEYTKVDQWETFSEEDQIPQPIKKWETFENEPQTRNSKNLQLEMSFGRDQDVADKPITAAINGYQIFVIKFSLKLHT